MRRGLILLMILLLASPGVADGLPAGRVLRSFDFEEREAGNLEDTPMHWAKLEGPGLPHYVNAKLSTDDARSGKYSFRFDLNGGSLLYRYPHGYIKVAPQANYRVSVMVKASPLPNARARLTGYFTDIDGRPILASRKHSTPYAGGDGWKQLEIELEAGENAAWLVLELGLVQPSVWRQSTLGKQALYEQDITGTAWFDDLAVAQVPRVGLSCDAPGNIFRKSDPLALRVRLSDRFTDDLVARLIVTDAAGKQVFQRNGALDLVQTDDAKGKGAPKHASIVLPSDLPAGWYRVSMQLMSQGVTVGDESVDLIRLADDERQIEPDPRFGVVATQLPFEGWRELPTLLPYLGVARVKLSVWSESGEIDGSRQLEFALVLERLRDLHIVPTSCLAAPPPSIAALVGGSTWNHVLKAPPESWQPHLSHMVSRYAGYLDRWQFGLDEQATEFVNQPQMRQAYQTILGQFNTLMSKPDLAMPWPAMFESKSDLPMSVALSVPSEVLPHQIPLYVQELRQDPARRLSVSLQLLPADRYGREQQLRDLVQRIAYCLSTGLDRIDLPLPFAVQESGGSLVKQPSEMLLVTRTLLQTLGNATYKGRVPISEDVEAFLFDRHGEGVLLMWSRAASSGSTVQIVLGNQPRRVDLWGNVSPVLQPKDASGVIDVAVGPMPIMLVGIDGQLAQMRSSFAINNPLLESSFKPHVRRLRFSNPYPTTIAGKLRLAGPTGWSVVAQQSSFSLAPGESYDGAITIEFPYNSFAGTKVIDAEIELQSGAAGRFKVPLQVKLGLGDIGLSTIALRDGNDVLVQQVITNYSDKPVDYTAFAIFPDQARQERLVTQLKPGTTIIKKYRFTDADFTGGPKTVRSGVKETEGTRVLNDEVAVQ